MLGVLHILSHLILTTALHSKNYFLILQERLRETKKLTQGHTVT